MDNDETVDVVCTDVDADNTQFFITNSAATIVRIPAGDPPFSLSGFPAGGILIWKVAYSGDLIGDDLGDNLCLIESTTGCVALSNPVIVTRFRPERERCRDMIECEVNAGMIALNGGATDTTICVSNDPGPIGVEVTMDADGDETTFIITDNNNNILEIPAGNGPFDLSGAGEGVCLIYQLSYDGELEGLMEGASIDDLEGCVSLSNPIIVTRNSGGDCEGDNEFIAFLNGIQELPCPVTTTGEGQVSATLDGNTLTVRGSFDNLESDFDPTVAGGAHLHAGQAGMGGPIVFGLTTDLDGDLRGGTFDPADNVFVLTDAQVNILRAHGLYVNIHTLDHPGGELRGQVLPVSDGYSMAVLSGANENPSVPTDAFGGVAATLNGNVLTVSGSFSGLMGEIATNIAGGAHIHLGIAGRNGAVQFPLTMMMDDDMRGAKFPAASNSFTLSDEQLAALDMQMLYVNIHSTFETSGEIRGQMLPYATTTFYAEMSGHQARPMPINTPGNGKLLLTYNADDQTLTVSGSLDDLSSPIATEIAGGGHLHLAVAGRSGPVVFPLDLTLDDDEMGAIIKPGDNTFPLTADQVESFYARGYYANFHTDDFQSGEIRGQVLNLAKQYFGTNLAGINQKPEVVKTGAGGFVLIENCDDKITVVGSFDNLMSDFAADIAGGSHLHVGNADRTGPIFQRLVADVDGDLRGGVYNGEDNCFTLEPADLDSLRNGAAYLNVHSVDNPSGEIRGQILNDDDRFPGKPVIVSPEDGETVLVFDGGEQLRKGTFERVTDPDGDLVVYTVEATSPEDTDFSDVLVCRNLGVCYTSEVTIDAIYDTLIALGGLPGMRIPLRYRIVASDGSVKCAGPSRTITIEIAGPMPCDVEGGTLALEGGGDMTTICAGDGMPDPLNVSLMDNQGNNVIYVITDDDGEILKTQESGPFDLDDAGEGTCLLYALTYDGDLEGLTVGEELDDVEGCYALSNPITVVRQTGDDCPVDCDVEEGGTLTLEGGGDMTTICAGDGMPDPLSVSLSGNDGDQVIYVITDEDGEILATQDGGPFDLDDAGEGSCLIYALSYDGDLEGLEEGEDLDEVEGCYALSNPITVVRQTGDDCPVDCDVEEGGTLTLEGGGDSVTICAGDGTPDPLSVSLSGNDGDQVIYVITDEDGEILDTQDGGPFDLDDAGEGTCLIYALSYDGDLEDLEEGEDLDEVEGCYALSNPITVTRQTGDDCEGGKRERYFAVLNGLQELPCPVTTMGYGTASITLEGTTLEITGSFENLSSAVDTDIAGGAHVHIGQVGRGGPIALELTTVFNSDSTAGTFMAADNTFELTAEQVAALEDYGLYINVHTENYASGEVRGQILPGMAKEYYMANLLGPNEVPSVTSTASGVLLVRQQGNTLTATGGFSGLMSDIAVDIAGGAHIHEGLAGQNGPIVFPLTMMIGDDNRSAVFAAGDNSFMSSGQQRQALDGVGLYVNIHSVDNPSGELRGQLAPLDRLTSFLADLSGHQERPAPVDTEAHGRVMVDVSPDGSQIQLSGSFADLTAPVLTELLGGAHLHLGLAGQSGPVVFEIDLDLDDDELGAEIEGSNQNRFDLDADQLQAFFDRRYYANVHSENFESGEIRGQVLHLAKGYFGSNLKGANARPQTPSMGGGFILYEFDGSGVIVTGSFADLTGDFDASIAGGAHIHEGDADSSGPIAVSLNATLDDDLKSGFYAADMNDFDLTEDQVDSLLAGSLYYNLHTTVYPAGEIRGQILRADNSFPEPSFVTVPEDGSIVTIMPGLIEGIDAPEIAGAVDPDGDLVVYSIEFATAGDPDFATPLFSTYLGTDTVFITQITDLYDTLRAAGFEVGSSATLLYRIMTSDGSVMTVGPTGSATFVIGINTGALTQPLINEVARDGQLEFLNPTNREIDFSKYSIVRNGETIPVTSMGIVCGTLRTKPGDLLTMQLPSIDVATGELALYAVDDAGALGEIVSYLAWGNGGEAQNEAAAVAAGLWIQGDRARDIRPELSLQLIPNQTTLIYALAKPTLCALNSLTTSVSQPAADYLLTYPNPVSRELTVEYRGLRDDATQLQLIDIRGRLVLEQQIAGRNGLIRVNMADLAAGTYTLRLANRTGVSVTRVVRR